MIDATKANVLCWSGGLESTLLLAMLREQKESFDILQIRGGWTKAQKERVDRVIKDWDLRVFSFPPASINFAGENGEYSAIFEIPVDGGYIPLIRDLVDGEQCLFDIEPYRMTASPLKWTDYYVGSRKDDTHYLTGQTIPGEMWTVGRATLHAPLWDKSRAEVVKMAQAYEIDTSEVSEESDTGNLVCCHNCIKPGVTAYCPKEKSEIPTMQWSPEGNARAFRQAFQIGR